MLLQLLALLESGHTVTTEDIARRLGVTRPLVEAMLVELEQRGYVQRVGDACSSCPGCSIGTGCTNGSAARLWTTRRGRPV